MRLEKGEQVDRANAVPPVSTLLGKEMASLEVGRNLRPLILLAEPLQQLPQR